MLALLLDCDLESRLRAAGIHTTCGHAHDLLEPGRLHVTQLASVKHEYEVSDLDHEAQRLLTALGMEHTAEGAAIQKLHRPRY